MQGRRAARVAGDSEPGADRGRELALEAVHERPDRGDEVACRGTRPGRRRVAADRGLGQRESGGATSELDTVDLGRAGLAAEPVDRARRRPSSRHVTASQPRRSRAQRRIGLEDQHLAGVRAQRLASSTAPRVDAEQPSRRCANSSADRLGRGRCRAGWSRPRCRRPSPPGRSRRRCRRRRSGRAAGRAGRAGSRSGRRAAGGASSAGPRAPTGAARTC